MLRCRTSPSPRSANGGRNPDRPGQKWRRRLALLPLLHRPRGLPRRTSVPDERRNIARQQARSDRLGHRPVQRDNSRSRSRAPRSEGRHWFLLDLSGVLDSSSPSGATLTTTRRHGATAGKPYPLPTRTADLDARFFRSDRASRRLGGLFGLDGVHPTTSGYALLSGAGVLNRAQGRGGAALRTKRCRLRRSAPPGHAQHKSACAHVGRAGAWSHRSSRGWSPGAGASRGRGR